MSILIMNIQSYAMPGAAYFNPMAYSDLTGLNKWVWILGHIIADQKFMTLFSLLFGAAIVLMTGKVESKSKLLARFTRPFAAAGRMAFTNYLLQTHICTTIFYGHGLGLFGQVERNIQILIVIPIWVLQLIISPIWIRYFRFGPVEWLWRSLTYKQFQPMRNP